MSCIIEGIVKKRFFPTVFQRLKFKHFSTDFKLTQVLFGQGKLNSYLFRFRLETSGLCACGEADKDVEHIILQCKLHASAQTVFKTDLKHLTICWSPVFSELVKSVVSLAVLCKFV